MLVCRMESFRFIHTIILNLWTQINDTNKKGMALSPAEWATLKDLISVVETELGLISCKYITNTCHSNIVNMFWLWFEKLINF